MARATANGDARAAEGSDDAGPEGEPYGSPPADAPEERPSYPVHVVRFGLVRACIWRGNTPQGPRHNVTVSRLYRGGDDAWHASTTFSQRDLLPLAKALDWAHTWIAREIAGDGYAP